MLLAACATTDSNPLAEAPVGEVAPPDIAPACELAARRCARCHSLDRITRARITEPDDWRRYVHKMRLMPASGIPPAEEPSIARCLVFRVAGNAGLARLGRSEP
ncbi:MAG TPA: hypothetical protein VGM88_06675 [Kofleriaceae bacterium]